MLFFILSWMNPSLYFARSSAYPIDFMLQMRGEYYYRNFWVGHDFLLLFDGFDAYGILSVLDAGWRNGKFSLFVEKPIVSGFGRKIPHLNYQIAGFGVFRGDEFYWAGPGSSSERRFWMGFRGKVWAFVVDMRVALSSDFRKFSPVFRIYFLNILGVHYPALIADSSSYMITAGASSGFQYDSSTFHVESDGEFWRLDYRSTFSKPAGSFINMSLMEGKWLEISVDIRKKLIFNAGLGLNTSGFFPLDRWDSLRSHEVYPYVFFEWRGMVVQGGYRLFSPDYMPRPVLGGIVNLSRGLLFASAGGEFFSRRGFIKLGVRWRGISLYFTHYTNSPKSLNRLYEEKNLIGFSIMSH